MRVNYNLHSRSFTKEMDKVEDIYEDMGRLNTLYEELCWDSNVHLDMIPDYKNNCIIIKPRDTKTN